MEKMKAGPQNWQFARATCSKVSSATVWVKYPQVGTSLDKKCATKVLSLELNSPFWRKSLEVGLTLICGGLFSGTLRGSFNAIYYYNESDPWW